MEQSKTLPVRGHVRNKSSAKATRPRSSTKGPLDADENPLASPGLQEQPALLSPQSMKSPAPTSPRLSADHAPITLSPPKDFSFILRPETYHQLTPLNVPPPFRSSPNQPSGDTSLDDLLAAGHFRAAAIKATQELTGTGSSASPDAADHTRIFSLLYTRLACLTLIDATSLAAQEVKILEDLNAAFYVDEATGQNLVPWELRVLSVRLQALGFGDARRAVTSYYDLAREARAQIADAVSRHDHSASEVWKARLTELGIRVAGALIELEDLAGAAVHLGTLRRRGDGKLAIAMALLWLHLGDVNAARAACVVQGEEIGGKVVSALCDMADNRHQNALATWSELRQDHPNDEMIGVNTAVCLLYVGRMAEGKEILEGLVNSGYSSHTLLFNLTTMYELCTDRSRAMKMQLAQTMANAQPTPRGWEKSNADFKL